jgi:hypothetical protein
MTYQPAGNSGHSQPPDESALKGYRVRRFAPEHAHGIVRLVEAVYGDSYYPRELYDPEQIISLNESDKLVSIVCLDAADNVIGHYALERPHPGPVAESSDAIVHPDHRHHHLMEEMRIVLREEANRLGLTGLVGYPVTNHVFSQKAEEHFGAHPCAVTLGLWPKSFHNMPEALPQRMSFVVYFKYLRPPAGVLHVATHHQEMVERIYRQFGIPVTLVDDGPATGTGEVAVEYESAVQAGTIHVARVGADTVAAVRRARQELVAAGAEAVLLELPLAQVGTPEVGRAAEAEEFFFAGVGPAFAGDGDALLLQHIAEPVDASLLQIENPSAKELLAYIGAEELRVRGANRPRPEATRIPKE